VTASRELRCMNLFVADRGARSEILMASCFAMNEWAIFSMSSLNNTGIEYCTLRPASEICRRQRRATRRPGPQSSKAFGKPSNLHCRHR